MTHLARVQTDLQDFLLDGDDAIEAHVVGTERVPVATRLGIYGRAYRLRLIEALESNYPQLANLLGEDDFATLGTAYVRAHPSRFPSIRYYGDELPAFLEAHPDYTAAPVLAELARWEWAMTEVFDAADAEPVSIDALAQVSPEQWGDLRFDWHPSLRKLALFWNAPQIWKSLDESGERLPPTVQDEAVTWLLWRRDLQILFRSLSLAESAVIDASLNGACFGELCELLCEHVAEEEAPGVAAGFLREWIESGLVTRVGVG